MPILEYLNDATIDLSLKGETKEEVLSELVEILLKAGKIEKRESILESLLEREGLGSTGIGHGVAIPHGRSRDISETVVAVGRTVSDVDFDSIDGKPTRLFFLLVAPENGGNDHLFILAKIARLIKDAKTREQLMELKSPGEVLSLIQAHEST